VYRRYRVRVEDVFLIYHDGILLSHLTNTRALDTDEDTLSGMLTAVQAFVQDAFAYGEHREVHQLEFGEYHILIERGTSVYLAVVFQGRDSGLIRKKVRTVLDRVESSYGTAFARWEGDIQEVREPATCSGKASSKSTTLGPSSSPKPPDGPQPPMGTGMYDMWGAFTVA
jgi:hypothetical protein